MRFWKRKCPEDGCPKSFWLSKNYYAHLEDHVEWKKQVIVILTNPVTPLERRKK